MLRQGTPYDLIVVDESHQMRDFSARRTRHLHEPNELRFTNRDGQPETRHLGAWSWTTRLWCLTGTPVVNSAADLWPMFYGALRQPIAYPDFCARFAERMALTDSGEKPVGLKNAPELAERMRPFTLRRTLASVGITLPPLTMQSSGFDLPPAAMTEIMAGLEGWTPQRLITALEQNDTLKDKELMRVRRVLGLGKCLAVATYVWEQLTKHASGPVIVFFYHQDVRAELHRMLHQESGFRVGVIDGKTTARQLATTEAAFQNGEYEILLAQIQSAGQGLTLHRSHVCCFAELPWTSTAVWQAAKRISRIGQTAACTATVLKVKDFWLEDVMAGIISKKQQASETLLNLLTSAA
jgi:SNF2 family DNA or RNA helicase